jgi:hypothetical protein
MSERALADATGHGWDHWFGLLDEWGGAAHPHKEIARWLMDEQGVAGWWSQSITVGYERAAACVLRASAPTAGRSRRRRP